MSASDEESTLGEESGADGADVSWGGGEVCVAERIAHARRGPTGALQLLVVRASGDAEWLRYEDLNDNFKRRARVWERLTLHRRGRRAAPPPMGRRGSLSGVGKPKRGAARCFVRLVRGTDALRYRLRGWKGRPKSRVGDVRVQRVLPPELEDVCTGPWAHPRVVLDDPEEMGLRGEGWRVAAADLGRGVKRKTC